MAKAGSSKSVSTSDSRKKELMEAFIINSSVQTRKQKTVQVAGYWGDRCIVGDDGIIYNVEADLGYKFKYSQLIP